jgi:hypothetical protein
VGPAQAKTCGPDHPGQVEDSHWLRKVTGSPARLGDDEGGAENELFPGGQQLQEPMSWSLGPSLPIVSESQLLSEKQGQEQVPPLRPCWQGCKAANAQKVGTSEEMGPFSWGP